MESPVNQQVSCRFYQVWTIYHVDLSWNCTRKPTIGLLSQFYHILSLTMVDHHFPLGPHHFPMFIMPINGCVWKWVFPVLKNGTMIININQGYFQTHPNLALLDWFLEISTQRRRHMLCSARAVVWRSYAKHHPCQAEWIQHRDVDAPGIVILRYLWEISILPGKSTINRPFSSMFS